METVDYTESNFSQGRDSHCAVIRCLSFNANGVLIASGGDDNSVKIWDVKSGKLRFHIEGHSPVLSLTWTPNPYILIVGFEDNVIATVVITEVVLEVYGMYLPESQRKPRYPIECLALSAPSSGTKKESIVKLAGGGHGRVRVWDLLEGTDYQWGGGHEVPLPFSNGPNDSLKVLVTGLAWVDETVLLVSYMFHGLLFWDTKRRVKRFSMPVASSRIALHPDRKTVATYNMSDGVDIWDAQTGERTASCKSTIVGENLPLPVVFLPGGSLVAAGHMGGQVRLWNFKNGSFNEVLDHSGESVYAITSFRYHNSDTFPNRSIIATAAVKGANQHKVRFWEASTRSRDLSRVKVDPFPDLIPDQSALELAEYQKGMRGQEDVPQPEWASSLTTILIIVLGIGCLVAAVFIGIRD